MHAVGSDKATTNADAVAQHTVGTLKTTRGGATIARHAPVAVALLAGVALSAAACGTSSVGAATTSATPAQHDTTTSAPVPTPGGGVLANAQPCDVLTRSQLRQLTISVQGQRVHNKPRVRSCEWKQDAITILVVVHPYQGLASFDLSKHRAAQPMKTITVAGHAAKQQRTKRACAIAIAVTHTSRIDVLAKTPQQKDWCTVANHAATLAASNLPHP